MRRTTAKRPRTSVQHQHVYPPGVPRRRTPAAPPGLLAVSLSVAVRGWERERLGAGRGRDGRKGPEKGTDRKNRRDTGTPTDPESGTRTTRHQEEQTRHASHNRPTKRHQGTWTPRNTPAHTRNAAARTNRTNRTATRHAHTERPATRRGPPGPSRSFGDGVVRLSPGRSLARFASGPIGWRCRCTGRRGFRRCCTGGCGRGWR